MGERKLATGKAKKAVAVACQEAADEAMLVQMPGGVFSVRWDERGSATALGQLAFFAEYLQATGLFEAWLKSCPLGYTSPNAPELVVEVKRAGRPKAKDQAQAELHFIDEDEPVKSWEYAVLVCNTHYELENICQLYRDRTDCENGFDEIKMIYRNYRPAAFEQDCGITTEIKS